MCKNKQGGRYRKHVSLAAIFGRIHLSLLIYVQGYSYRSDIGVNVSDLPMQVAMIDCPANVMLLEIPGDLYS